MPANVRACIITIHNRPQPYQHNYTTTQLTELSQLSTMSASDIIKQVVSLGQENKTLQENLDKAMTKIHELEEQKKKKQEKMGWFILVYTILLLA